MLHSDLAPALLEAYRAAEYRVHAHPCPFSLHIDEPSPALARLYDVWGCRCAAYLTAFNPSSKQRSDAENLTAHRRLLGCLESTTVRVIEGVARDPTGVWSEERSVLSLGLELDQAKRLGTAFGQHAIVWAGRDAVPRLVTLR